MGSITKWVLNQSFSPIETLLILIGICVAGLLTKRILAAVAKIPEMFTCLKVTEEHVKSIDIRVEKVENKVNEINENYLKKQIDCAEKFAKLSNAYHKYPVVEPTKNGKVLPEEEV